MKLHLPVLLRSALLATFGVVTTVGVGFSANGKEGTTYTYDTRTSNMAPWEQTDCTDIVFNLTEATDSRSFFATGTHEITQNVEIQGLYIDDSYNNTLTFSGTITGTGDFVKQERNNGTGVSFIFTGGMQGYSGNVILNSFTGTLTYGNSLVAKGTVEDGVLANVMGTGNITLAGGTLKINYAQSDSYETLGVSNNITAKTIVIEGDAQYKFGGIITGKDTTRANNRLTVGSDSSFAGGVSNFETITSNGNAYFLGGVSNVGTLTLNETGSFEGVVDNVTEIIAQNGATFNNTWNNVGTVTVNGASSFSGTIANIGTLQINAATRFSGDVTLLANQKLKIMGGGTSGDANFTLNGGGLCLGTTGTPGTTQALTTTGTVTIEGTFNLEFTGTTTLTSGTYNLVKAGTLNFESSLITYTGISKGGRQIFEFVKNGGVLSLVVSGIETPEVWTGAGDKIWKTEAVDSINSNWSNEGTDKTGFIENDSVVFNELDGVSSETVKISGNVTPLSMIINGGNTAYTFVNVTDDSIISGSGSLTVNSGAVTISMGNSFSGGTTINEEGSVKITSATALGSGNIAINGGALFMDFTGTAANNIIATPTSTIEKQGTSASTLTGYIIGNVTVSGGSMTFGAGSYTQGTLTTGANTTTVFLADGSNKTMASAITGSGSVEMKASGAAVDMGDSNLLATDFTGFEGVLKFNGNGNIIRVNFSGQTVNSSNITIDLGDKAQWFDKQGNWASTVERRVNFIFSASSETGTQNNMGALRFNNGATYSGTMSILEDVVARVGDTGTNRSATFSGNISGDGTLLIGSAYAASDSNIITLSGENSHAKTILGGLNHDSAFTTVIAQSDTALGHIVSFERNNSLLQVEANVSVTQVLDSVTGSKITLSAGNSFGVTGDDVSTFNGLISGDGSLIKSGVGTLTLGGSNTYTGGTEITGGTVVAGADHSFGTGKIVVANAQINMGGYAHSNNIDLTNASLSEANGVTGRVSVVSNNGAQNVSLGNLSGSSLSSVSISGTSQTATGTSGTTLSGLASSVSLTEKTNLAVGSANIGSVNNTALIQFTDTTDNTLSLSSLNLTLDADAISELKGLNQENKVTNITLTNGTLAGNIVTDLSKITFSPILEALGFYAKSVEGGNVVISGNTDLIYTLESGKTAKITSNEWLNNYAAIFNNGTMNISLPAVTTDKEGLVLNNLNGNSSSSINIVSAGTPSRMILNNSFFDVISGVTGIDTTYAGTLTGGNAQTEIVKTGDGKLTMSGQVNVGGSLVAEAGSLVLASSKNTANEIRLAGGNLTLKGDKGAETVINNLNGSAGTLVIEAGNTLKLVQGESDSVLNNTTVSGSGVLSIGEGVLLTLGNVSTLSGVQLNVEGNLTLNSSTTNVTGLTGNNTEAVINNGSGTLQVSVAEGKTNLYQGSIAGNGTFTKTGKGTQILQGSGNENLTTNVTAGTLSIATDANNRAQYNALTVSENATYKVVSSLPNSMPSVSFNAGINFQSNSTLGFVFDPTGEWQTSDPVITTAGQANLGDMTITLDSVTMDIEPDNFTDNRFELVLLEADQGLTSGTISVIGLGSFDIFFENLQVTQQDNKLILTGTVQTENPLVARAQTETAKSAGQLLWASRYDAGDSSSNLYGLYNYVKNTAPSVQEASQALSASLGSSGPAVNMAQHQALRSEMFSMRNRTSQVWTSDSRDIYPDETELTFWCQGNGGYNNLDNQQDLAGYKLNTVGGTVGFDFNVSRIFTSGVAFSANYGDFTSSAADSASGDLDTYFLNYYAHLQLNNWGHRLVATGARTDAKINRTVAYGKNAYTGKIDTDGTGYGLLYEVNYDIDLRENKSMILQPLMSIAWMESKLDAYTETGAGNAGLIVRDQKLSTTTIAAGARFLTKFDPSTTGRSATGELRMNIAQDMGDDQGEATVSYVASPANSAQVKSNKIGKTALQIGAGFTAPIEDSVSVFGDINTDFRSGATSINANLGMRFTF